MNVVVFDLEWNQACPGVPVDAALKAKLPFEVIDIGAVRMDERGPTETFERRIRPVVYTQMNPFIRKVTGLRTRDLKIGEPFAAVWSAFRTFLGDEPIMLSWSPSDTHILLQNVAYFCAPAPSLCTVDVQRLFRDAIEPEQTGQQRALAWALERLGLAQPKRLHSALADAWGTAEVYAALCQDHTVPPLRSVAAWATSVARVTDVWPASDEALGTRLASYAPHCPLCGRTLQLSQVDRASRFRARRYVACTRHGLIRETLSRPGPKAAVTHTYQFGFIGASYLTSCGETGVTRKSGAE